MSTLLEVKNLSVAFTQANRSISAVSHINFAIAPKEIVGIVGESGSGKSVSMLGTTRLLPPHAKRTVNSIMLEDKDISQYTELEMREILGRDIAYIYQEPSQSYDPLMNIYNTFREFILTHEPETSKEDITERIIGLLKEVGIHHVEERMHSFFHQFSGGMIQRVQIALALTFSPKLLIADEPTTALDVTTQKKVMDLLLHLCKERDMAMVFITHDLALVSSMVDRILVMKQGAIVEEGTPNEIIYSPTHEYTKELLEATINFGDRYGT